MDSISNASKSLGAPTWFVVVVILLGLVITSILVAIAWKLYRSENEKKNDTALAIVTASLTAWLSVVGVLASHQLTQVREIKIDIGKRRAEAYQELIKSWIDATNEYQLDPWTLKDVLPRLEPDLVKRGELLGTLAQSSSEGRGSGEVIEHFLGLLTKEQKVKLKELPGLNEIIKGHDCVAPKLTMWGSEEVVRKYGELRRALYSGSMSDFQENEGFSDRFTQQCAEFVKAMRNDIQLSDTELKWEEIIDVFGSAKWLRRNKTGSSE